MVDEVRARINYLNRGPWIEKGKLAWQRIGQPPGSSEERSPTSKRQIDLRKLLRPHWERSIRLSEGLIRDSFDEALTVYQLYELAIENGYIGANDVKNQVQKELTELLWSDGSRTYLLSYNYLAVIYLAERVGVDLGFKPVQLPSIREGAAGRFASFLSQHALWYEDPLLDDWIGFLDDFQVYDGNEEKSDKGVFWDFLRTKQRKFDNEAALWAFVAGADRFLTRMADLAALLSDEEKPSYGLFYAYWLSKYYGYDWTDHGYVRDSDQADWAVALLDSKRIAYSIEQREKEDGTAAQVNVLEAFRLRDAVVRKFWADTVAHLNRNRILPTP
jgi:hypothetical protein